MAEETSTQEGFTEDEVRSIIGEEIDSRLKTFGEGVDSKLSILDGLDERIGNLFKSREPSGNGNIDRDGLLKEIGDMVDAKLRDHTPGKPKRNPGPLGRLLNST